MNFKKGILLSIIMLICSVANAQHSYKQPVEMYEDFTVLNWDKILTSNSYVSIAPLTYTGTNIISDFSVAKVFRITLTNDAYLKIPTNVVDGQVLKWWITQGTGTNLLTLDPAYILPTGTTNLTLSVEIGSKDVLIGEYDASSTSVRLTGLLLFGR